MEYTIQMKSWSALELSFLGTDHFQHNQYLVKNEQKFKRFCIFPQIFQYLESCCLWNQVFFDGKQIKKICNLI